MEGLVGVRDRSVLLTGHTGFKGGWLTMWLASLGARVHGYALGPTTDPNLFEAARIAELLASDTRGGVADLRTLRTTVERARPEVIFHLAAQPLVSVGYRDPLGTFATNVLGTANLLEAVRDIDSVRAVVIVATDKVYANSESGQAFREGDPLGGHDPYSGSKAAAEVVVASYRTSFFGADGHPARIASARAGNVVGGGDWSADRLVPDCLRAFASHEPVRLRHPESVRPWQHVLEPLSGYLVLATRLLAGGGETFARAWNFGPDDGDDASVGEVARKVAELWGDGASVEHDAVVAWSEAGLLRLDSSQARRELGWTPSWSVQQALEQTVEWQRAWRRGEDMQALSRQQIEAYTGARVS